MTHQLPWQQLGGIGIIGGLGPLAGAHVYECLVRMTPAVSDQEHPSVVLLSRPFPSRIAHLGAAAESPLPQLVDAARSLGSLGCTVVGLASATTHAYRRAIEEQAGVPIADGLREVAGELRAREASAAVVLCTSAARQVGLYNDVWPDGVALRYPAPAEQTVVDGLIDNVKTGAIRASDAAVLHDLILRHTDESTVVVLGCTELPVLWVPRERASRVVSVSDAIAGAVLAAAGLADRRRHGCGCFSSRPRDMGSAA
ncbi:aspartate/glutamate racemase family protein [Micromonospora sp. NPDC047557]|uniref:aspartate/glutamate racemase family protein n=1 Tax=Micromonospora sp. NPDC047557 TaxID=3364250 RepID=UPI0037193573